MITLRFEESPSSFEKEFEGEIRSLQLQDAMLTDAEKDTYTPTEELDRILDEHSESQVIT